MALSAEEKERIVEEETLRQSTRRNLHAQACAGRPGGGRLWLWCAAFFVLGYAVHGLCGRGCGWGGCSHGFGGCRYEQGMEGYGMGPGMAPHCRFSEGMEPGGDAAPGGDPSSKADGK